MNIKEVFKEEVVRAILRRKEINETVIIVSKLMEAYGMSNYISLAHKLILAKQASDKFIEDHVILDFVKGDIWLDIPALYYYEDVLTGYIEKEDYKRFIRIVEGEENMRNTDNQLLKFYQKLSTIQLFQQIRIARKQKVTYPFEVKMLNKWCRLELLSRTGLPKIYYFIKELPIRIKVEYIGNQVIKDLKASLQH